MCCSYNCLVSPDHVVSAAANGTSAMAPRTYSEQAATAVADAQLQAVNAHLISPHRSTHAVLASPRGRHRGATAAIRRRHPGALRRLYAVPGPPPAVRERVDRAIIVNIYRALSCLRVGPLVVMVHEGGWCVYDVSDEDQNCRMFARDVSAVFVDVGYRCAFCGQLFAAVARRCTPTGV